MDAYIYNSDLLCDDCGKAQIRSLNFAVLESYRVTHPLPDIESYLSAEMDTWIRKHPKTLAKALRFDPTDETTYDSGDYPKGPYADGGGESDSPQHCGNCHIFLENPLTADGARYVLQNVVESIINGAGDRDIVRQWWDFYSDAGWDNDDEHDALHEIVNAALTGRSKLIRAYYGGEPPAMCDDCGQRPATTGGYCATCAALND